MELLLTVCLGIGLAAAAGFRVFLPLLALSLAAFFDYLPLNEGWQWLGSTPALILLATASVIEIFAYYIPWVDNALDVIAVPLATIAGIAMFFATTADFDPLFTWSLALIGGGGTATLVAGTTAAGRAASSATTAGFANPVFSTLETGTSILITILALILPILAAVLVVIIIYVLIRRYKKRKANRKNLN